MRNLLEDIPPPNIYFFLSILQSVPKLYPIARVTMSLSPTYMLFLGFVSPHFCYYYITWRELFTVLSLKILAMTSLRIFFFKNMFIAYLVVSTLIIISWYFLGDHPMHQSKFLEMIYKILPYRKVQ